MNKGSKKYINDINDKDFFCEIDNLNEYDAIIDTIGLFRNNTNENISKEILKYIDSKCFNPDNLKERKIKLLKNRVIKRINSGEFLHKKEVNKYIKDYYSKQ